MVKRLFITLLLALSLVGCDQKPKIWHDIDGHTVNLQDYRGKWVVINYWASWCIHCLQELPSLNHIYQTNQDKLVILGVNYDQLPVEQLKPLVKKLQIKFPILANDPAADLAIGHIDTLPVTFLIDPTGKISPPKVGKQTIQSLQEATGLTLAM